MRGLPFFFARRYLFAKKSRNVINLVSGVSALGMAVGTAALVIILSVYNGFDSLIKSSLEGAEPDIKVTSLAGKFFVPDQEAFDWASSQASVGSISGIVEDNVYVTYNGRNAVARAVGVDDVMEKESPLLNNIVEGEFSLHKGDIPLTVLGRGLASKLQASPRFIGGITIHYPDREGRFSPSDPASSLRSAKVWPSGIFSVSTDMDGRTMIIPVETMRELVGLGDEVSAVEIRMVEGTGKKEIWRMISGLRERLGEGYAVRDRWQQNESLYRMMRWEKISVFMILVFVIVIVAFNIFGSLQMLMIEKEEDIRTIHAMGGTPSLTRRIFVLEGWMVSMLGMAAGVVIGLAVVLLQLKFGFIRMPGTFAAAPYPVVLRAGDVIATAVTVSLIGYLIALIPSIQSRPGSREE